MDCKELRNYIVKEIEFRIGFYTNFIIKISEKLVKDSITIEELKSRKDDCKELNESIAIKKELEGLLYFVKHSKNFKKKPKIIESLTLEEKNG